MTPKHQKQSRSPFNAELQGGHKKNSSVRQRASDGYQIIQEYQALTKNGSRRGEEMFCQSQLDQILSERCKKSIGTGSNKMISALLGNKNQIISPRNSSLRKYVKEYNTTHNVDKMGLDVEGLLPTTQTIQIMQSNVPSPVDSPKIEEPLNVSGDQSEIFQRRVQARYLQNLEVLSRQTNERPTKAPKNNQKQMTQASSLESKKIANHTLYNNTAIRIQNSPKISTTHAPTICGITQVNVKNSPIASRRNSNDPWQLHQAIQTRSVIGNKSQEGTGYESIVPNGSKVQSSGKALEGLNFKYVPQIGRITRINALPDNNQKKMQQSPILVQSPKKTPVEIDKVAEPTTVQMFDQARFTKDKEFAIYKGLESATDSDDEALNSYLTQNLMNYQLDSPQGARKVNELDELQSTVSIDSDRFRSISQIFKKQSKELVGKKELRASQMTNQANSSKKKSQPVSESSIPPDLISTTLGNALQARILDSNKLSNKKSQLVDKSKVQTENTQQNQSKRSRFSKKKVERQAAKNTAADGPPTILHQDTLNMSKHSTTSTIQRNQIISSEHSIERHSSRGEQKPQNSNVTSRKPVIVIKNNLSYKKRKQASKSKPASNFEPLKLLQPVNAHRRHMHSIKIRKEAESLNLNQILSPNSYTTQIAIMGSSMQQTLSPQGINTGNPPHSLAVSPHNGNRTPAGRYPTIINGNDLLQLDNKKQVRQNDLGFQSMLQQHFNIYKGRPKPVLKQGVTVQTKQVLDRSSKRQKIKSLSPTVSSMIQINIKNVTKFDGLININLPAGTLPQAPVESTKDEKQTDPTIQ